MAKIKITPLRSFFDDGKGFFFGKKYSVDEEQAAAYIREGWAAEAPAKEAESSGADGGNAYGEGGEGGNASGEGGEGGSV